MPLKIDLKDRKILYQLDINSRQPFSSVAKKVGLSKQTTINRVRRLEEGGAIQKYLSVLDLSLLGYSGYKVLLRFQSADREKRAEIVSYVNGHPNVEFVSLTDGNFDLNFNIFARNIGELDGYLHDFNNRFGKFMGEKQMMPLIVGKFYPRSYLAGKKERNISKHAHFGSREEESLPKLDAKDRSILKFLGQDARASASAIAQQLSLSPDAVRLRIKRLEKEGVIQKYAVVLGISAVGRLNYKVLIRLENLDEKRLRGMEEYWSRHPNIWFSSRAIGPWDEEINIDAASPEEFRSIMNGIKERFSGIIRDYSILAMYSIDKLDFYPFAD
ncbi:MAG: Lrp/AsnC family transcriptional regulator [Candidatus Micrarchaeota archaeon]|nr:Lrp/AsnC family transcriptional regulator [Candidatus Micrarchaeota archaeon]